MTSTIKVDTVQDTDGNNIINENANTITIGASGDTITIPSGATIDNQGTSSGFASIAWQSSIVTAATLTAVSGRGYWIDTSSNAITLTLPASPSVGDQIIFTDYARNWGTNAVTLNLNSEKFQGNATPVPVYDTSGESVDIVYSGSTKGWIPNTDGAVALATPQPYTANFLVIAGGGGGAQYGGGGGAGGYRNSFNSEASGGGASAETALSLTPGTVYTVTIGTAGAGGGTNPSQSGNSGGDSSITGSDITNIVSVGGGYGESSTAGTGSQDGGSGGGGQSGSGPYSPGGTGTANQGFDGGDGHTAGSGISSGGGGGASAVGAAGTNPVSGAGGNGVASTITGSSVTRAGGGGGGADNRYTGSTSAAAGGSGGGGNATVDGTAGAGTVNTGSGGGGAGYGSGYGSASAGGTGIVVLRMATSDYSGTTSGNPSVTNSGGDTIITFTGDGSYTG